MRFADGPTTTVSIEIDADVGAVWPILADPALSAGLSDELQSVEWRSHPDGQPGLGSTFEGFNESDRMGAWSTISTITRWDVEHAVEWTVGDVATPVSVWRFELIPADTHTRVDYVVRLGPGPSGLTEAIAKMPDIEEQIVQGRLMMLAENMTRVLEAAKERAE